MKKTISVVVPIYNEKDNVVSVYERITAVMAPYQYELIFVNDGSIDGSREVIESIVSKDTNVKYIEFSRNFSKEVATSAGIHHAKGDAVILIDADLQHPPELIPDFINRWEGGSEMVIGVRKNDMHEGFIKHIGSRLFYKIMKLVGDIELVPKATDFRLIDRKVADEFNKFTERNRITRGILDWLGFKKEYVHFNVEERYAGKASYSNKKLFTLALSTIVSHSTLPLRITGYLGVFITLFSATLGLFIIIEDFILHDPLGLNISGTAMIAVMILFLVGVVITWLGLIAFYILNIQKEVMNRPMYVIHHTQNFK